MTKPAVEFNDIEMHFSDTVAVSGINLSIRGEVLWFYLDHLAAERQHY